MSASQSGMRHTGIDPKADVTWIRRRGGLGGGGALGIRATGIGGDADATLGRTSLLIFRLIRTHLQSWAQHFGQGGSPYRFSARDLPVGQGLRPSRFRIGPRRLPPGSPSGPTKLAGAVVVPDQCQLVTGWSWRSSSAGSSATNRERFWGITAPSRVRRERGTESTSSSLARVTQT